MDRRQEILSRMARVFDTLTVKIQELEEEKAAETVIKNECLAEGDLRENAGYHAAIEKLQHMEVKFKKLDNQRTMWEDFKKKASHFTKSKYIGEGSLVTVRMTEGIYTGSEYNFLIVPELLGDASINALSTKSALGKELLSKKLNDTVSIRSNRYGLLAYTVIQIE